MQEFVDRETRRSNPPQSFCDLTSHLKISMNIFNFIDYFLQILGSIFCRMGRIYSKRLVSQDPTLKNFQMNINLQVREQGSSFACVHTWCISKKIYVWFYLEILGAIPEQLIHFIFANKIEKKVLIFLKLNHKCDPIECAKNQGVDVDFTNI